MAFKSQVTMYNKNTVGPLKGSRMQWLKKKITVQETKAQAGAAGCGHGDY